MEDYIESYEGDWESVSTYIMSYLIDGSFDMSFAHFQVLLDSGKADVTTRAPHGGTCITAMALQCGDRNTDCYKALCYLLDKYPAMVNDRSGTTETPLHLVTMYGHGDALEELIRRGADPTLKTYKKEGIAELAKSEKKSTTGVNMVPLVEKALDKWNNRCHLPECDRTQNESGSALSRCSRCRRARYCCLFYFFSIYQQNYFGRLIIINKILRKMNIIQKNIIIIKYSVNNKLICSEGTSRATLEDTSQTFVQTICSDCAGTRNTLPRLPCAIILSIIILYYSEHKMYNFFRYVVSRRNAIN